MTALLPLGNQFRAERRDALRARLAASGLDGALLLLPANVLYLTGFVFSVNERPIGLYVPLEGEAVLHVPLLEKENAEVISGVSVQTYFEYPGEDPAELTMITHCGAKRLAVDALDARFLDAARDRVDSLTLTDPVAPLRFIKTQAELALTREAARFADLCLERLFDHAGTLIADRADEIDLLNDCVGHARDALFATHGTAFSGTKMGITASVHSGPRAALPHGATTDRKPQWGETLIAGIGCSLGGYHAESGVTLIVGEMSAEQRAVMQAMQACNDAAIEALKLGAVCAQINAAALNELQAAGLGEAIRHRIGHGMGVEGHEAPWLAPGDATAVAPNMVFSNEPGVYRPGRDGYRTINTMIVHENGVEIVSRFLTDHPIDTRIVAIPSL